MELSWERLFVVVRCKFCGRNVVVRCRVSPLPIRKRPFAKARAASIGRQVRRRVFPRVGEESRQGVEWLLVRIALRAAIGSS